MDAAAVYNPVYGNQLTSISSCACVCHDEKKTFQRCAGIWSRASKAFRFKSVLPSGGGAHLKSLHQFEFLLVASLLIAIVGAAQAP